MDTVTVKMNVPTGMAPYLSDDGDADMTFERNAMMLYPLIHNLTISHGRAADILGVHKTDLIEFYGSMGIPYLNQTEEELASDISAIKKALGAKP